jgi:hypothetical protein
MMVDRVPPAIERSLHPFVEADNRGRVIYGGDPDRPRRDQHEAVHTLGSAGREHRSGRTCRAHREQRGTFDSRGVHHSLEIQGALLDRGDVVERV